MRVRIDTYDEFKTQAGAGTVYYLWDQKLPPGNLEAPLFFARTMKGGVVLEFWDQVKPATFDADFPAAVHGEMEE